MGYDPAAAAPQKLTRGCDSGRYKMLGHSNVTVFISETNFTPDKRFLSTIKHYLLLKIELPEILNLSYENDIIRSV
jgi:hypothetical protein